MKMPIVRAEIALYVQGGSKFCTACVSRATPDGGTNPRPYGIWSRRFSPAAFRLRRKRIEFIQDALLEREPVKV